MKPVSARLELRISFVTKVATICYPMSQRMDIKCKVLHVDLSGACSCAAFSTGSVVAEEQRLITKLNYV